MIVGNSQMDMTLHLFHSLAVPNVFGFTQDATGTNLPPEYAPWEHAGEDAVFNIALSQETLVDGIANPICTAVERDGYYLGRTRHPLRPARTIH